MLKKALLGTLCPGLILLGLGEKIVLGSTNQMAPTLEMSAVLSAITAVYVFWSEGK